MTKETIRKILTRDFILVTFAQFAFLGVYNILVPTLPIYLVKSGSGEVEIGIIVGVFFVSALILRPFVGKALLRTPEKTYMLAGGILFIVTCSGFFIAPPFWPLFFLRLFQGIGLALFHTACYTFAVNISPKEHVGQSLGYFFLANNISMALFPSVGMFLINDFGFPALFLTCVGLSLSTTLISGKLTRRVVAREPSDDKDEFLSWKSIPPSVVNFLINFVWGGINAFFPLYALSHGVSNSGLFFTAIAAMLFLGRIFGGKILDVHSRDRIVLVLIGLSILSMALLAVSKTLTMFILVGVIWGLGNSLLAPAVLTYVLDRAGDSRGPAMGMFLLISDLGLGLGSVIMGVVIRLSSYSIMFLGLAFVGVINLVYFHLFVRKRGPRPPQSS